MALIILIGIKQRRNFSKCDIKTFTLTSVKRLLSWSMMRWSRVRTQSLVVKSDRIAKIIYVVFLQRCRSPEEPTLISVRGSVPEDSLQIRSDLMRVVSGKMGFASRRTLWIEIRVGTRPTTKGSFECQTPLRHVDRQTLRSVVSLPLRGPVP